MTEYESAEWSDNQDLQWVGYVKFRQMVWSQMKRRFEVIPEDSMVPSRLISGTIVQTVKVLDAEDDEDRAVSWFGYAEREIFGCFAGDEECAEESDEPFQRKRMQCVTECSRLKSTGGG